MIDEIDSMAVASGWVGLFAPTWLNRRPAAERRRRPRRRRPATGTAPHAARPWDAGTAELPPPPPSSLTARHAPGWRFDDTRALPTDAPRRLEQVVREVADALRRLPPAEQLSHRALQQRAHLQRTLREAAEARTRLAAGTYGTCTRCARPVPLAVLDRKPWEALCTTCALDL